MEEEMTCEYTHFPLNQEITAIGGHYVVTKELKLDDGGREILCIIGYGVVDTSCCGTGGCSYATVQGYIKAWKKSTNQHGLAVTRIDPIRDEHLKKNLKKKLMGRENIQQVNFL